MTRFVPVFVVFGLLVAASCGGPADGRDWIQESRVEIARAVKASYPDAAPPPREPEQRGEHFVAVDGKADADGSEAQPWPLAHALSGAADIRPGDTIWLRAGTYEGSYVSELIGAPGAPIVVRSYPRETAILSGCADGSAVLTVNGQYAWMWGFEVTGCAGPRTTATAGSHPEGFGSGAAVDVFGNDIKIVELRIHDAPTGIGCWVSAKRTELIGNIIYYNGWDGPDRGHGHGIYIQNEAGTKRVIDNVIFSNFGNGIHAYGETAPLNNLQFRGNVSFMNGQLSSVTGLRYNLLIGGGMPARNATVEKNFTFFPEGDGGANNFGYTSGCEGLTAISNYFVGGTALRVANCSGLSLKMNTFLGKLEGISPGDHSDNSFLEEPLARPVAMVQTAGWSDRRALAIIYNWPAESSVQVKIDDAKFRLGERLAVRSVEDLGAEPRILVREQGEPLELPLTGWSVATPVGLKAPASALPTFGVFVIEDAQP